VSNFFAELKRRNVFRMAGLYLVGAWLVVQVAETLLPAFDVPGWVLRAIILVLAIGFVPALVFSWIYELTPEGLKRDEQVDRTQSIAPQTARRMDRLLALGLVAVVAIVAADRYWPRDGRAAEIAADAGRDAGQDASAAPAAGAKRELVAVLPFRNRSPRPEDAYFAEGVHDDLLTQLSRIGGLKVISRTSMMRYADSKLTVPQIAAELGAAVVLEGAVQRAGEQVRINVQLIDGLSDVQLWGENYDRELSTESIFAIQADIARAVSSALEVVLSPEQDDSLRGGSTRNIRAYEALLRGKLLSGTASISAARSAQAIAEFDQAIALDPGYAEAYARKARMQLITYWLAIGPKSLREEARLNIAEATRLAPDAIETLIAQALHSYYAQLDYATAEQTLKQVLERAPDHAEAWEYRAYVARRDGRFDDSIAAFERARSIDPQAIDVLNSLIEMALLVQGDFARARVLLQQVKDLSGATGVRGIWLHRWSGDIEGAWAAIDGPTLDFVQVPFEVALDTRDPERIALALSPALWPEALRSPGDFPEAYALAEAEALRFTGQQELADQRLAEIQARLAARTDPYPSRWLGNAIYNPCDLPGLMGDLAGVRAAEADFLQNAPRDVWGSRGIKLSLATAFARAGDPERAMSYLDDLATVFGPHVYLWTAAPGLDSLREHPRYQVLKARYEAWEAQRQ
jgi:TolB-like protein